MTQEYGEGGFLIIGKGDGDVLAYNVDISEREKKGYTPALVRESWNHTKGRRVWVRTRSAVSSRATGTASRKKTLKEREHLLDRKRLRWAIAAGTELVAGSEKVPSVAHLLALALHSGTKRRRGEWGGYGPTGAPSTVIADVVAATQEEAQTREQLWRSQLWPVLQVRFLSCEQSHHDHRYAAERFDELRVVAAWVGAEVDHLVQEAIERFPEPKSWAGERAAMKRAGRD